MNVLFHSCPSSPSSPPLLPHPPLPSQDCWLILGVKAVGREDGEKEQQNFTGLVLPLSYDDMWASQLMKTVSPSWELLWFIQRPPGGTCTFCDTGEVFSLFGHLPPCYSEFSRSPLHTVSLSGLIAPLSGPTFEQDLKCLSLLFSLLFSLSRRQTLKDGATQVPHKNQLLILILPVAQKSLTSIFKDFSWWERDLS